MSNCILLLLFFQIEQEKKPVEILHDVSEEDERSCSEEEEGSEEGEEEIESGESEEEQEVPKAKKVKKQGDEKRQSNKLQTTTRIKRNGKAAGSSAKTKVTTSIPKDARKRKQEEMMAAAVTPMEEEEEGEEEENDDQTKKDQSSPNKPTITFGKSMVRDYSQPAKRYCRDKFLLGNAKKVILIAIAFYKIFFHSHQEIATPCKWQTFSFLTRAALHTRGLSSRVKHQKMRTTARKRANRFASTCRFAPWVR